ncbi:sodium:solute symporter [Aeoliella sp. ICT_H6.2]|uniref:Sodium:solute symporter n=1 Tax=Aeoliella straminimaris TaxID=2954799 RepID=A0A9X2JFV9_9BACT|nr:sodium:solute symporter [Aeoliella straminimaris]MCO6042823.1 sodium:solute symporter [Aeoliella straminimaris]
METVDWLVVGGYFALLAGLAWWVIRQSKDTSADYFLAGHSLGWFIVGASIFASNIGSEHLVGLAGSGATDGVAMAHYELHAWCLLILAWVLVPFYARSQVFTMPQFLERRFSPASRYTLSVISLVAYIVTKIAVGIFAGGIVFSVLLPELSFAGLNSFWIGSILVLIVTGLYTVLGGFRAVAYTETLQTIILIIGSALVTYFGLKYIGGWGELKATIGSEMFNLWKPLTAEGVPFEWAPVEEVNESGEMVRQAWYFNTNYPWLGMLFCAPIIGLWYWCTDQYIVQRALGAENETQARRGSIFAALLKLLPVFIFIVPGMICFGLIMKSQSGGLEGVDFSEMLHEDGTIKESGKAFPLMVKNVLPAGVRGLVVAGLLSALMSSLAGVFNACSTLFTIDLYKKFAPEASERRLVQVGRWATVSMVLIGMAWIPVIQGSKGLYDYLQSVQGYLAPPIFVVFFLGIAWKRLNAQGCLAALLVGFAMGIFRLAVDTPPKIYENFAYTEGSFFWIVNKIYFQYFSLLITVVSAIVMIGVSYLTREPDYSRFQGLTYGVVSEEEKRVTRESWGGVDVGMSVLVLALILGAYLYFQG